MSNEILEVKKNNITIRLKNDFTADLLSNIIKAFESHDGKIEITSGSKLDNPISNKNVLYETTEWNIEYLVSSYEGVGFANHTDPILKNPHGIVIHNNRLWVVNNGSDTITSYDLYGNRLLGQISMRNKEHNSSFPTGIVTNSGRIISFIIASEHGTVSTFNPVSDILTAHPVLNMQLTGQVAVYRGLAFTNNTLYLADFFQRRIDVFDSSYNRRRGFIFVDSDTEDPIPPDYSPNNIVHIDNYLYVLYARKEPIITTNDIAGKGHGFISVFNLNGSFVRRFTSRGVLNSPWAMIPAPDDCGFSPGTFLVGNNGDGRINIFDESGQYLGQLLDSTGNPIIIGGLWGLAPHYTDTKDIFFTGSNSRMGVNGFVGKLTCYRK